MNNIILQNCIDFISEIMNCQYSAKMSPVLFCKNVTFKEERI